MTDDDISRWEYRLEAYRRALSLLADAAREDSRRGLSNLEKMGLTQAFEITVELGWKLLKDVLRSQGLALSSVGPNDVVRMAFESEIVADGRGWLSAIRLRNELSHTYKEEMFLEAIPAILGPHLATLAALPDEIRQANLT